MRLDSRTDPAWTVKAFDALRTSGYVIVEGVIPDDRLPHIAAAMHRVRDRISAEVGSERLERAGELGVLRLMVALDPSFADLLTLPEVLAIVDGTVSETAILHLQNGFILPSIENGAESFQHSFHRDFPRYLNGYVASVNTMLAIDPYTAENGGTLVVPGSQQRADRPEDAALAEAAIPVECPAGSMVAFDSTLWHAAGQNRSGADRLGINQQFTRSFIKQQVDYVRALGDEAILALPDRAQQLLGWYTRVVTTLDEYYQPTGRRLYRSGQG